ncbi:hypothetical protein [Neorhizobium galegae]|uniref:hypothetical protein n=1 Tax=Neorhizobium galegae TaxID=399 RepID=UPI00210554A7|nr:hypothetical protein [Neorhizobium galegae]MCQ1836221.1 hypothetical protein [Neorhizobium galegae]UIY28316.1 hypothetical protein LZK73_15210 [Neorhizobium galegae]
MTQRMLSIGFQSPTFVVKEEMTLDNVLALLAHHVPDPAEMADAVTFLDMHVMDSGRYDGTNWSVWFVTIHPTEH